MSQSLPLAGIRVIEFCQVAAGPFTGMLLADMGADVIKVEPPQGDSMRAWPPLTDGFSENFASLNRSKRSIALNLKDDEDRKVAQRLIRSANVVIENNRPGVMDRLGLGYGTFKEDCPGLVYCAISAFGQTGPRANDGGFDVTVQAVSGIMSVTGEPDGAPVKAGVPMSDFASGLYAAYTIAALLRRVAEGGPGGYIDVPMLGASLGVAALQTSEYFGSGKDPRKLGSAHPRNAPYQGFKAKDDYFVLAAGNNKLWSSVCQVIDRPDLEKDTRFLETSDRAKNQVELKTLLEDIFVSKTAVEWIAAFRAVGVPCEPINTYSSALAEPQVDHMGWIKNITLPSGAQAKTFGNPICVQGLTNSVRRNPPELNADRDDILDELDNLS